jgi:hypothetical protein
MKIHCTDTRTFELVDGSETLGQIYATYYISSMAGTM